MGLEALAYGAWILVGIVLLVPSILAVRAIVARKSWRKWADLAGFVIGAGGLGALFAVPDALLPTCPSGGVTFSGPSGGNYSCALGPQGPMEAIAAGYVLLVVVGVGVMDSLEHKAAERQSTKTAT